MAEDILVIAGLLIVGLAIAFAIWLIASYTVASALCWFENSNPDLVGSKAVRTGEAIACAIIFLTSVGAAFWVTRLIWLQLD